MTDDYTILEEHWVIIESLDNVVNDVSEFVNRECFEQWSFVGGDIMDAEGKIIGIYNPNNRTISKLGVEGNDFYWLLPDWDVQNPIDELKDKPSSTWFEEPKEQSINRIELKPDHGGK